MPSLNTAFVAGAFGGISPELARYLVRAQGGQLGVWLGKLAEEPWASILVPIVVSAVVLLLLGLLGGLVAHFGNEPNIGKAFMLGIGAPAFVLSTFNAAGPVKEVGKDTKVQDASIHWSVPRENDYLASLGAVFITAGHAQDLPMQTPPVPQLTFDTKAIAGACPTCRVEFQDSSGSVLSSEPVGGDNATVTVPDAATSAILSGVPDTNSAKFSLESLAPLNPEGGNRPLSVEVIKSRNYLNDFRYILGNNAIEPFDLELKAAGVE